MRIGRARKPLAIVLFSLAGLGGLLCVLALFAMGSSIDRNAATGDFAGASLLMSFVLVALVAVVLANVLRAAHQHYGTHGRELVRLALLDLLAFSPTILLVVVLGTIGGAMLRRGRIPE